MPDTAAPNDRARDSGIIFRQLSAVSAEIEAMQRAGKRVPMKLISHRTQLEKLLTRINQLSR